MISLMQKEGSCAVEPEGWCVDVTCSTGVSSESEGFEEGCEDEAAYPRDRSVLLRYGGPGLVQQVGGEKRFLAISKALWEATKPISLCAILLAFFATALLMYLLKPAEGFVGGPLGERCTVCDYTRYKGPTWRKDGKCTWQDTAKDRREWWLSGSA